MAKLVRSKHATRPRTMLIMLVVEIRYKAVEVLLAVTAGAYQTTLLTYLIQRDLFPSVMKVRVPPAPARNLD
jgi:hypothetical protein